MKRGRILQVFNRYLEKGGEEGSVYRIGDALQEIHDVEYYLGSSGDMKMSSAMGALGALSNSLHNFKVARQLERFQRVGKFNCWQVHNVFPAMSPVVYQKAFQIGVPIVHYLHNYRLSCVNGFFINHGEPCQRCIDGNFVPAFTTACWRGSHLKSAFMGMLITRARSFGLFEKVSRWIAISEATRQLHIKIGIPAERIEVVRHFLEPSSGVLPFPAEPDALFIGRLSVEKGVADLLRAWSLVSCKDRTLFIVGEGPERQPLERLAAQLNLKNVVFTGYLSSLRQEEIWARCGVSIVPSIWEEPLGMVVLESWMRGRPVVANDIGALPEMIEKGIDGDLVPVGDAVKLAAAIEHLLTRPAEAAAIGQGGREKLEERFGKQIWIEQMRRIYHDVMNF